MVSIHTHIFGTTEPHTHIRKQGTIMTTFNDQVTQLFSTAQSDINNKKTKIVDYILKLNIDIDIQTDNLQVLESEIADITSTLDDLMDQKHKYEQTLNKLDYLPEILKQFQEDIA